MKIVPQHNQAVGRIVDFTKSAGGIDMPDVPGQKPTIFVILDGVGSDVKDYTVGQIVLPHHVSHILLRGGQLGHVILDTKDILAVVEDAPITRLAAMGNDRSVVQA